MDKCKEFIYRNQSKIKAVLLIASAISAINCFSRFDYNIVVYLYIYFLWDNNIDNKEMESSERLNSFFFLLASLLFDLMWIFTWPSKWASINDYESNVHTAVTLLSWVGLGFKGLIIFSIGLIKISEITRTLPKNIQEKLAGAGYTEQIDD